MPAPQANDMMQAVDDNECLGPQPIPDHSSAHCYYHAYAMPRESEPADAGGADPETASLTAGEESKPLRQLRAYLRSQEEGLQRQRGRRWWHWPRHGSQILLVLVGICYLGGRGFIVK